MLSVLYTCHCCSEVSSVQWLVMVSAVWMHALLFSLPNSPCAGA